MAIIVSRAYFKATHIWHCVYGHLFHKCLRSSTYKGMVKGLPKLVDSSKVSSYCMIEKQLTIFWKEALIERNLKAKIDSWTNQT